MGPMTVDQLLKEYADSYFHKRDHVSSGHALTAAEKKRGIQEYESDPLRCLTENVEESRTDVQETAARMRLAKDDGLLDRQLYASASKAQQKQWRGIMATLKGDFSRAREELDHWRGYVGRELERQRAAKALPQPDRRLPPEKDPDESELPF
jgi:hypothetical protein